MDYFSVHLQTYQTELLKRCTRLSSILETDSHLAQQAQREVRAPLRYFLMFEVYLY